ncbi:hypothetical protein MNBD_NITROSPINAE02-1605 [hydrothermal vent metagenome]|uniref:Lipopolysaccharide export system protein LptC n=1 Tax=hydrothermal vent metagenome TaxID=652676 RepID=A0A3B1BU50_9ZZZZ
MRFVIFVLLLGLLGVIGWFIGISDVVEINTIGKEILRDTNVVLHGVRLVEKKYNKPSLQLVAAKSVSPLGEEKTYLERFTLISYSDDTDDSKDKDTPFASRDLTISAENGVMMNETKDLEASGNVIVRDEKGRALITESLSWDQEGRVITTDGVVRVFGSNFVLTGTGMIVRPDDETVEILSDVKATFEPRKHK